MSEYYRDTRYNLVVRVDGTEAFVWRNGLWRKSEHTYWQIERGETGYKKIDELDALELIAAHEWGV